MPYIAENDDTSEIVIVEDADPLANFVCPDCYQPVAYVRAHSRAGVGMVSAFFRYDNCSHAGITPSESTAGGPGSEGSCGESSIHKQRKWTALQAAIEKFDHSSYSTEKDIGSKRADAVLELQEPHKEYGRGFVIEYQHKNESKDIVATERHFAKFEYTTLWLWEDQFASLDGVPEVDLFEGRVCTPWPYAVPEVDDWFGLGHGELRKKWKNAHKNDLTESAVPATICKDWVVPTPKEYWRDRGWDSGFRSPDGLYPSKHHRAQALVPKVDAMRSVPANIPRDWYWTTPKEYWKEKGWSSAFRLHQKDTLVEAVRSQLKKTSNFEIECSFPPDIVDSIIYEDIRLDSLPDNPPTGVQYGGETEINAKLPPDYADSLEDLAAKYICRECVWTGNEPKLLEDGSIGGTAVCPECSGGITIN